MHILTWNIHGWKTADHKPNLTAIADALQQINADIIGLNEVSYPQIVGQAPIPALDWLAQQLGMQVVFGACQRWPAQNELPANAFGNAILSRWPIIASSAHLLSPKEEDKTNLLANKNLRGLLEGRILLPDQQTFTVYVTHFDHTDEEARLIQLRVARTWLSRDRNRPHILMGDFNALSLWDIGGQLQVWRDRWPSDKGRHLLGGEKGPHLITQVEKAGYVDCYSRFGQPGAATFTPALPNAIRMDYIFASERLAPAATSCTILQQYDGVSDHRPVLVELEI